MMINRFMKFLPGVTLALVASLMFIASPVKAEDLNCADGSLHRQVIQSQEACEAINLLFTQNTVDNGRWYDQNPSQFAKKVLDPSNPDEIFGERYTYAQINWIINSIATMLNPAVGISNPSQLFDFLNAVKEIVYAPERPTFASYSKLGPIGLFAGTIDFIYASPPASAVNEIKVTASKIFDFGTGTNPALAQGVGYSNLSADGPVRVLWTASRNMAYLLTVLLLIASGFLIMFKVKINPQAVITLQNLIPKLAVTVGLITFSLAIAGLVIDLIYVVIVGFIGMLSLSQTPILGAPWPGFNLTNFVTQANGISYLIAQMITPQLLAPLIGIVLAVIMAIPVVGVPIFVIGAFVLIVFVVFSYIVILRILLMLLTSYVTLILQISIAPLQIMLDLIPGQKGFSTWLRNLFASASVFAVVPILFIIQRIVSWDFVAWAFGINSTGIGSSLSLPFSFGSGGDIPRAIISWFVGFMILTMTPKIAEAIRESLKVPAFKYGTGVTEAIGFYKGAWGLFDYKGQDGRTHNEIGDRMRGSLGRVRGRGREAPGTVQ